MDADVDHTWAEPKPLKAAQPKFENQKTADMPNLWDDYSPVLILVKHLLLSTYTFLPT